MNYRPSRKALIAAAAVLALGGASIAVADHLDDGHHDHDRYGKGYERLLKNLDDHIELSEAQEAELERIFIERREAALALREQGRTSLQELITADAVTADEVIAVLEGVLEPRAELDPRREAAEVFAAVHAVLTPEQRAALAARIGEHGLRWGRHGRWFSSRESRHDGRGHRLFGRGHDDDHDDRY
ncbi:MAG: Spy/CpxP family protein refolding chaperone [Betaproteobacteria bacterium AqS2]|uniref:Spy/CpxP family protein refolding chaperone n=1 Tax=Candidatus Amphirhobacter heronislandensis TaxID=1732024 RepID=A0A930UB68_9GAMM|nr:Spy/CpxP family protein refolding chaperone [Betaproteobacteria bacterium AqS2]